MGNSNATTLLELASEFFGCEADDRLFHVVKSASIEKLQEFYHNYKIFAAETRSRAPTLTEGELRPYLPANSNSADWIVGDLQLSSSTFDDYESRWQAIDKIKHRLLYCHSVALDHPLGLILEIATSSSVSEYSRETYRNRVVNFFRFMIDLRPLIEAHILCLTNPGHQLSGIWPKTDIETELRALIERDHSVLPKTEEFIRVAPQNVKEQWAALLREGHRDRLERAIALKACDRINRVFGAWRDEPEKFNLYFPFQYDVRLIAAWASQKDISSVDSAAPLSQFRDRDTRLLNQFLELELPGLRRLDPKQIATIRAADKFVDWRNELREALQKISQLPSDYLNRERELQEEFKYQMRSAQKGIEAEFKKSSFLAESRDAGTKFVVGGVGILAGILIHPAAAIEIIAKGGTKAAEIGTDFLFRRVLNRAPPKDIKNAILSHYVAAIN